MINMDKESKQQILSNSLTPMLSGARFDVVYCETHSKTQCFVQTLISTCYAI